MENKQINNKTQTFKQTNIIKTFYKPTTQINNTNCKTNNETNICIWILNVFDVIYFKLWLQYELYIRINTNEWNKIKIKNTKCIISFLNVQFVWKQNKCVLSWKRNKQISKPTNLNKQVNTNNNQI